MRERDIPITAMYLHSLGLGTGTLQSFATVIYDVRKVTLKPYDVSKTNAY